MNRISIGNAHKVGQQGQRDGWFVGHFIDDDKLSRTQDIEVKWGVHAAGESNRQFSTNQTAKTMSVLIRGKFHITFQDGESTQDVLLEREGDYVLWDAGVAHNWVAKDETVILTIRWPSIPKDQVGEK